MTPWKATVTESLRGLELERQSVTKLTIFADFVIPGTSSKNS